MGRTVTDAEAGVDSDLLRDVAAGSSIELTDDGVAVARLVPPNGKDPEPRSEVRSGGFSSLPRVSLEAPMQTVPR